MEATILNILQEGGTTAVVGIAFLFVLRWMLNSFAAALLRIERAIDVNTVTLLSVQQQQLAHDLTVTGLNPAAGANVEERTNKAYAKYSEVKHMIAEVQKRLLSKEYRNGHT